MPERTAAPLPLIPIVLGFAGHRDLRPADEPTLRRALEEVFDQFDAAYPGSPKVLLSPLAPGADQLAAGVALERIDGQPRANWSVRAPLPFLPDLFLRSTSFRQPDNPAAWNEAGQRRFAELRDHDRVEWFVVPLPDEFPIGGRVVRRSDGVLSFVAGGHAEPIDWPRAVVVPADQEPDLAALRRACYANPGAYIVRHCHTLIALWDGADVEKPSGTAEIVRFQLSGRAPQHYPGAATVPLGFDGDRGPVIWIRAPRTAGDGVAGTRTVLVPSAVPHLWFGEQVEIDPLAPPQSRWRAVRAIRRWRHNFGRRCQQAWGRHDEAALVPNPPPAPPGPWHATPPRRRCPEYDQFLATCRAIDDFNAEVAAIPDSPNLKIDYDRRLQKLSADALAVFPSNDPDRVADQEKVPLRAAYERVGRVREAAALLSVGVSAWHDRVRTSLIGLLAFALLAFHIYAHPPWHAGHADHPDPIQWALLGVYYVLWLVLGGVVVYGWSVRLDDRRYDYRALAEALRVRQLYATAGLSRSVADGYMNQLRTELSWVRRVLQHVCPPSAFWAEQFQALSAGRQQERLERVRQTWAAEQHRWYARRATAEHHSALSYRRYGLAAALLGLLLLGATPVAGLVTNFLLVAGGMAIILGGLSVAQCERRAHEPLARQYDHMSVVFRAGDRELTEILAAAPADVARAQRVVEALGAEAIEEHAKWLLVRRSKAMELPLGG